MIKNIKSAADIQADIDIKKAADVRAIRNTLIDRVTREINRLEDVGKDAKAWRDYRIVLRNVPEQDGFPQEIDWGKQPAAFTGK